MAGHNINKNVEDLHDKQMNILIGLPITIVFLYGTNNFW